jgi:hypothetical protein
MQMEVRSKMSKKLFKQLAFRNTIREEQAAAKRGDQVQQQLLQVTGMENEEAIKKQVQRPMQVSGADHMPSLHHDYH